MIKFLIFIFVFGLVYSNDQDLSISIEEPKDSGNFVQIELKEFVKTGRNKMLKIYNSSRILNKGIMILGLSGTGKSTLVNYLNNIPLQCIKKDSKWILELKYPNVTIPGGFRIGHTDKSETQYPAVYTPDDKGFTYVDNPGFKDNRGIGVEIANGFFREQITKKIDDLKFVLLITHQDLNIRGEQFRDTIRAFSDFLAIFDEKDTKNLVNSVLILVTRVEQDDETDDEMVDIFKKKLNQILKNAKSSAFFQNDNEELVFKKIIENNQVGIFSNPRKKMTLDNKQSEKILNQIDKLEYIRTEYVKVRVRIQQNSIPKLLVYTEKLWNQFLVDYKSEMKKHLNLFYEGLLTNVPDMSKIVHKLKQVENSGKEIIRFETFIDRLKTNHLINESQVVKLNEQIELIDFLVKLLPSDNRKSFQFDRKWIDDDLLKELNQYYDNLIHWGEEEFKNFTIFYQQSLNNLIESKFKDEYIKENLSNFVKYLALFREQSSADNELDDILKNELFDLNFKNVILEKKNYLSDFFSSINDNKSKNFMFKRKWLSLDNESKIRNIIDFIEKYTQAKSVSFEIYLDKYLVKSITEYYSSVINQVKYTSDLLDIKINLDKIESNSSSFLNLTSSISPLIMTHSENYKLVYIGKILLDKDIMEMFGMELRQRINELKSELFNFGENQSFKINKDQTSFDFYGHLTRMSSIMSLLKQTRLENFNLKTVKIFATHSFIFDHDYYLDRLKYISNFPDLIIVAPFVEFLKPTSVDLSCLTLPDYPDNKSKARNGTPNGFNGEPGLAGFNGGNLYLVANEIKNLDYLNFKSIGGEGGRGQDGGDGSEGSTGLIANASKITFEKNQVIKTRKFNHKITVVYYGLDGESGTQGGNAGQGGMGGLGGFGGQTFITSKNTNKYIKSENGKLGINGAHGKPGLGGFYGDITVKGRFLIENTNIEIPSTRYDQIWPSKKRGLSGFLPENFNQLNRSFPIVTPISTNHMSEYKFYLQNIDFKFKFSNIFEQNVLKI